MVNFRSLAAEIGWRVWGSKFQRVSRYGFVTAATSLTEINQTLHNVSPSPELVHYIYIHFRKLLPINGILPGAKFTVRPSLAFSYISALGYTVRHSCSVRQPNRGVQQKAPPIFGRAAIMLGIDLKATF